MGAITETLRLLVEADTKGAVKNVEDLGKTAEREASRSKSSLDRWGNGLQKAGAGMVAFGSVALVGLGHAAMAFEEAHLSEVKLENTLSNMPKLAGENKQQFLDLAEAIQDKTAADADAIVEGEALLGTFQLTAKEIKGITPLVVDYARKFGMDIPQASIQVGKALDGSIGALKRNGVSIDETLYKTDRYAAVQKALAEQVGGFAEAEGKTFAGSLERLKNQLGDLEEGVGKGAVEAFTDLFGLVDGVTDKLNELSPGAQGAIGKVVTFGAVALIAVGGVSALIGKVITMRENFSKLGGAISANSSALGRIGRVAATAATEFAILVEAGQIIDDVFRDGPADVNRMENALLHLGRTGKVTGELSEKMGGDLHDLKNAIGDVFDPTNVERIGNVSNEIVHFGGAVGSTHLDRMHDQISDVDKALAQLASRSPREAAAALDALIESMDLSTSDARNFRGALDEYNSTLASIDTGKAVDGADELGGAMSDSADDTDEATSALQDYQDKVRAMTDPLFGAVDALHGVRDAQVAVDDANRKVLESEAALQKAIHDHGRNSVEAAEAQRDLEDAQRGVTDAQWDAVESASSADSALAALKDAVDKGDISVEEFHNTLGAWVRQGFLTQQQALQAAQGLNILGLRADDADSKRVSIPVAANGWRGTIENLATVGQNVRNLDGDTATVNVRFASTGFGSLATQLATLGMGIGHHAGGGPMGPGEVSWVGEDGPELLVMDPSGRGGHVYNDAQLKAGGGGGKVPALVGGGMAGRVIEQHIYHINGSLLTERQLTRDMRRRNRKGRGINQ